MHRLVGTTRRIALVMVAGISVLGSVALIWRLVTPDSVAQLPTGLFVGLLTLFLLPGLTLAFLAIDRKAAKNARTAGLELRALIEPDRDVHHPGGPRDPREVPSRPAAHRTESGVRY